MKVQTRSQNGAITEFDTLQEALEFAKELRKKAKVLESDGIALDKIEEIWKISFSISTGERVRLVWEDKEWVLRQMDEEIEKIRNLTEDSLISS